MSLTILSKKSGREISQRKLETYEKYCRVIRWGRKKPIEFASRFLGLEFLDIQSYAIINSWTRDFLLWLESRNGGKTTKLACYAMLRSMLLPFHVTYFLGNTGDQAKEVFSKLEKIAKKEIESFTGCTDVFFNELRKKGANSDGFVHLPASFSFELFNAAEVHTLNSDIINIKGKRANLVCFDESGWFSDELFIQAENFVNQSSDFKLGGNINLALEPKGFPRQLLYASSASDADSGFYKKFKSFTQRMLMGDQRYFVCDFDIDTVMNTKFKGEEYPPLLSRDKVDKMIEDDPEKAARELYNRFSADAHKGQILTPRDLRQCVRNRPPLLSNDTGNKLFVMSWDSARLNDNSVIEIAQLWLDPQRGWCMDMCNVVSLVDVNAKNKTPMIIPEQVDEFKRLLLKYNGNDKGKLDYENIRAFVCDSGAGGQMVGGITDYLLKDWYDDNGSLHKGLIDRAHKASETAKYKYPDAVDIVKLIDPRANRNLIFDAIERMVKLGIVTFPAEYEVGKEYVSSISDDGSEERTHLTFEEQLSLTQMELLKKEIVTMCKTESGNGVKYDFPPDKRNKMHDDRVFAFGLLCFYLAGLRRGAVYGRADEKKDFKLGKMSRKPTLVRSFERR